MDSPTSPPPGRTNPALRFRFETFTVSTGRRLLLDSGREVPLIPRYFDLLVLLLAERHRAVKREEILDAVWRDVIVSDGALSQAVRTLRRALRDTAREPRFIRTVARHGYRFVHDGVVEEVDASAEVPVAERASSPAAPQPPAAEPHAPAAAPAPVVAPAVVDPFGPHLRRLLGQTGDGGSETDDEARLEAAEALHLLGTD
ncbi:MAG TPA: winged helix-turn-helix domain-containing protein, partial [Candidatus Polarisedimenticolia bacterium]|nr:winged helix-turn-helix domain-containing protein [Candidatus Polarisedimenticolia bacterium]